MGLWKVFMIRTILEFEKSQTKITTFLWRKSSPTDESPFNFKNWSGKSDAFEKLVGEKWRIFQKWLNFSPTKIFPDKVGNVTASLSNLKYSQADVESPERKQIFNQLRWTLLEQTAEVFFQVLLTGDI